MFISVLLVSELECSLFATVRRRNTKSLLRTCGEISGSAGKSPKGVGISLQNTVVSIRPSNFRLERAGPRNAAKLVQVLYYADILLDLKQLKVFADQRLYDYLGFNALGLLIPPVVTVWEACHWLQQPSPERDHFDHLVRSKLMQKIIILLAVATQTHVILLVMWSVRFKQKLGITSWHHLAA